MRRFDLFIFLIAALYLLQRAPDPVFYLESTDHGYQLALGAAIAAGRLPGFDFITQYGPLVAVMSWLGLAVSGSLVGELVICAVFYAAAIALTAGMVRASAGRAAAVLAAAGLLLLFPRYYKWYYWLLPMVGLALALRYRNARAAGRTVVGLIVGWGLFAGIAALFRYDLGLEALVFGLLAIAAADAGGGRFAIRPLAGFFGAAWAIPVVTVLLILVSRGVDQAGMFLRSIPDGAVDSVDEYGISPFRFDLGQALPNALPLLQLLLPLLALAGLLLALRDLAVHGARPAGFALLCAALTAIGIFPQALHRADMQHLLQVLPPFAMVLALLARRLAGRTVVGAVALVLVVAVPFAALPAVAAELGPVARDPVAYWRAVAGLPGSRADNDVADMALAIRAQVPAGDTVFQVMPSTQSPMLFFSGRREPGIFPLYEAGMFASDYWLRHNRAALARRPPDFLVVPRQAAPGAAPYMPELVAAWRRTYTRPLHENARFILLARP